MLIGHVPAGYLFGKGLQGLGCSKPLFLGVLVGSFAPDLDMLWFHFVDHGSVHHHTYITHRPIVWLTVLLAGLVLRRHFVIGVGLGGVLHMMLDTIAGAIAWGWPFFQHSLSLVTVPATHDHWVLSFMAHWTFQVEITICAIAAFVFWRSSLKGKKT